MSSGYKLNVPELRLSNHDGDHEKVDTVLLNSEETKFGNSLTSSISIPSRSNRKGSRSSTQRDYNNGPEKETVKVEYYIHDKTFKERLKQLFVTNEKTSVRWQMFRFTVKIFSCIVYVTRAMLDTDATVVGCNQCPIDRDNHTLWCCPPSKPSSGLYYWSLIFVSRSYTIWLLQALIACFGIVDSIIVMFLNYKGTVAQAVNRYIILEVATSLPFIISLFWKNFSNVYAATFLHCWIAKNTLFNLFNDLHRVKLERQSVFSQKMMILVGSVLCLTFTCVCGIEHIERAHAHWSMFDSLWFVVVTFSTVGYGDIVPADWLAKLWVIIMIISMLLILPGELEELAFLLVIRQKEGSIHNKVVGSDRHVVICATTVRASTMLDFLNEFYADPRLQGMQVVVLSPTDVETHLRVLLQVPIWAQRVTYLKGSALSNKDLVRAKVIDAAGCFILSDRGTNDVDAADYQVIMRTWAIRDFAPTTPLYVQVLKPENKFHVAFADHVVCEDEIKHALLANNCVCPGFSTMVTLLLHTLREQKGSSSEYWHETFGRCAGNEIYHIKLGDSKMFRRYAYKIYTKVAYSAYKRFGVTLIGVRRETAGSPILLNPGPSFKLAYDDVLFYIAVTREEDMALEEFKKADSHFSKRLRTNSDFGSFVSIIDSKEDEKCASQEIVMSTLSDNPPVNTNGLHVSLSTRSLASSGSGGDVAQLSSLEFSEDDASIHEGDLSISQPMQRIPKYIIGVPPVFPYIGIPPLKCHILPEAMPFCCLQLNTLCAHREQEEGHHQLSGAVIVSSREAIAGLYNFILPLRAFHRPKCTLKPIVFLVEDRPSPTFLEAISYFPLVYYMVGSFLNIDDLLHAGILEADSIVVTEQRRPFLISAVDEDYMADAQTIVGVQTIYRLFPNTNIIIELAYPSNMRFMKYDGELGRLGMGRDLETRRSIRHTIKRRYRQSKSRKDDLSYLFREPFAAGHVFSASMIDTLLYQTFLKDFITDLIAQLLGCQQAHGSGFLTSMEITNDKIWIGTYGRLFQRLCTTTYDIPIGLYRVSKSEGENLDFKERKREKHDIHGIIKNRLRKLGLKGHHDMGSHQGISYAIVNPPPDFPLELGDLIYLIRKSPEERFSGNAGLTPPLFDL